LTVGGTETGPLGVRTACTPESVVRFSFGTTLYEMVTSKAPFEGKTATDTLSSIIRDEPPPPSQLNDTVPLELDRIIAGCLEKDPQDRYQHTDQLAVDLRKLKRTTDSGVQAVRTPSGPVSVPPTVKGRWRRWVWIAALVAVLVPVGFAAWRHLRPVARFQSGDRIIVADFENTTGRPEFDTAVRDAFEYMLEGSPVLTVITGSALDELVATRTTDVPTRIDSSLADQLCSSGGCDGFLIGKIESVDAGLRLEVNLRSIDHGQPVLSRTGIAATEQELLAVIHEMRRDLRRHLGEPPISLAQMSPPTTTSLLAFQSLWRGERVGFQRPAVQLTLFEEALKLDPHYIDAYSSTAATYWNLGRYREYRKAAKTAYDLAQDLPERRQLSYEITYLGSIFDYDGQLRALQKYLLHYPYGSGMLNNLGVRYWTVYGDYRRAETHIASSYEIAPSGAILDNLCYLLAIQSKADDIREFLREAPQKGLPEAELAGCRVLEDLAKGNPLKALDTIDQLTEDRNSFFISVRWHELRTLLYLGRLEDARSVADALWEEGMLAQSAGDLAEAGLSQAWLDLRTRDKPSQLSATALAAAQGDLSELEKVATISVDIGQAEALQGRFVDESMAFARGSLALISGETNRASELLQPIVRGSQFAHRHHVLGRAYQRQELWNEAVKEYEFVVEADRGSWIWSYLLPAEYILDEYRIATCYDHLGDTDRARHWYERFTEDWTDADPDIPELIEARKRLAELKAPAAAAQ
jgi:tetratricopeptide (TPR) repeat protein